MCCQIFDKRSVAPSSGGFGRGPLPLDKISNFEKRKKNGFSGCGRTSAWGYLREFLISSDIHFLVGLEGSTTKNMSLTYWFWSYLFFYILDTCSQQKKVATRPKLPLRTFRKMIIHCLDVSELNCVLCIRLLYPK